jgi:hypothetical protein
MSVLLYSDIEPYSTTYVFHTYPEKGHHLHHIPLPYIAYKAHKMFYDKALDVHQPKAIATLSERPARAISAWKSERGDSMTS